MMSLEHPGPGFNGTFGRLGKPTSLFSLVDFIYGYQECVIENEIIDNSWGEFMDWFIIDNPDLEEGFFSTIINRHGEHEAGFNHFVELLYKFLETTKPKWFVEFNSTKQPSSWKNINGPRSKDIRNIKHVKLTNGEKSNKKVN